MYLTATNQSLQIFSDATAATTEPMYNVAFNDHTSTGMTLPQSSTQGSLTGTSPVTAVSSPAASTNRQLALINVYNADSVSRVITVQKLSGASTFIVVRASLASGATLQFNKESGWTILNTNAGTESFILTQFTSNGTWTKPANLKAALVCCLGAGGGGGSGRRDGASTNRWGGGGGGGGALVYRLFQASSLPSSVAITVGTAGTGGTGITTDTTSGNAGTTGGDSSFGTSVIAKGGAGGGGGTSGSGGTSGAGGSISGGAPTFGPFAFGGTAGTSGNTTSSTSVSAGLNISGGAAGAGGLGINAAGTAGTTATTGSGIYANGSLIAGPTTGNPGTSNASTTFMFSTSLSAVNGLGTGGAGGITTNVNGTNAGNYGAGGGGGSGVTNGTTSGAGGNGSGGLVTVLEIY